MSLKRDRQPMPDDVEHVLADQMLMDAYRARPDYQQNDYLAWIARARREETRRNRLDQMLDELRTGDRYMNMPYRAGHGGERGPVGLSSSLILAHVSRAYPA